ncbi:MAG: hypothetical protein CMC08_05100 [Flavobacteriaceae bacterium]|nr:hypothetical protein [Flavobacteriaceae bacterium]
MDYALASMTCNNGTLNVFQPNQQSPWNAAKIKHTYRRLAFGASQNEVDEKLTLTPAELIDELVDSAYNLPPTPAPSWGYYSNADFPNYVAENGPNFSYWRNQTIQDLLNDNLRGRLTFFWMNHFVTEHEVYGHAPYAFQYYNTLQTHALGNFKELVRVIGKNPAMLIYLNGFENTNNSPNENYARELLELFTLGEGNGYSQGDIINTARALTGFNHRDALGGAIYFDSSTFDDGQKTIFGQTGNWGYDDVIDILFAQRGTEIGLFICEKLYAYFVSPIIDSLVRTNIIQPLAQTFVSNNFELVPVLKQLFKSEHFYDENARGTIIKSPYDVILGFIKESGLYCDQNYFDSLIYHCILIDQDIYNPPDVAGWQRDETWINTSTVTGRWKLLESYINYLMSNGHGQNLVNLAKELSNDSTDPVFITKVVTDHFMARELYSQIDYDIATNIFKADVPQNYYDNNLWNLDWTSAPHQVSQLLKHLAKIPDFQLK